jgi:hypothetical protein
MTQAEQVEMDTYTPHLAQHGMQRWLPQIKKAHEEYLYAKQALTPFVDGVNALAVQQAACGGGGGSNSEGDSDCYGGGLGGEAAAGGFLMLDHNIISTTRPDDLQRLVAEYQAIHNASSRNAAADGGGGATQRGGRPVHYSCPPANGFELIPLPDGGHDDSAPGTNQDEPQPFLGMSASDLGPTPTTVGEQQQLDAQTPTTV